MRRELGTALLITALLATGTAARTADGWSTQTYDGAGWVRYGMSSHPLNLSTTPTGSGVQNPALVYSPAAAWDPLTGYNFVKTTYTDSAAAATALATGQKTYNNAINWSDLNAAIVPTIVEAAHNAGQATGTISTVQFSHATPAGFSNAHNVSRNNYTAIANQMLSGPYLDVIMGAGNPGFNDNGLPASTTTQYVGGSTTWNQLKNGTHPGGWQLVQSKAAFEALATGNPTGRFVGVAQVATTLQQARGTQDWNGNGVANDADKLVAPVHDPGRNSFGDPFNANVPSLETMTRGALNILDADPDGFFLHVEGGAADWANHANQLPRMLEEQMAFNRAVEAVVDWVESSSNWQESLLIVTADHETGLLWGPDSATQAFDAIVNRGEGQKPLVHYNSGNHTNSLLPLYARGVGGDLLAGLLDGVDSVAASHWLYAPGWAGEYVDNTDVYPLMAQSGARNIIIMVADGAGFNTFDAASMWEGRWVPEPGALALIWVGLLAVRRRR